LKREKEREREGEELEKKAQIKGNMWTLESLTNTCIQKGFG